MATSEQPEIAQHLSGKTELAVSLYRHFIAACELLGGGKVRGMKSMIAVGNGKKKESVYVIKLGKAFLDVVVIFDKPYSDNFCFTKIAQVPNTDQYNHHLRILDKSDVNAEVRKYLKLALV